MNDGEIGILSPGEDSGAFLWARRGIAEKHKCLGRNLFAYVASRSGEI